MMNCHYIITQLERIQQAKFGAVERLFSGGSTGLEEQIQTMESAISRIRDEMRRRERARVTACLHASTDLATSIPARRA
jgi:hypothetical protein